MAYFERLSPVQYLRCKVPYVDFPPRPVSSQGRTLWEQRSATETHHELVYESADTMHNILNDTDSESWNRGYGSRHWSDTAPFSLWDHESEDFRHPAPHEHQWIQTAFQAVSVTYSWPQIFVETSTPPSPVPLTVACVAVVFMPVGTQPHYLSTDTGYSNPRIADPVPKHLHLQKWERPTTEQMRVVLNELQQIVSVKAVNFIPPTIIFEVQHGDGKKYERMSLPGRIAGQPTIYHHSQQPFWEMVTRARERLVSPDDEIQDTTNYLQAEFQTLCPGVRVESGPTSREGDYLQTKMASTAGVLIQSTSQGQRLTVSNHSFLESDEVYHPSSRPGGIHIGLITERFEHLDVALVDLNPSSTFTNAEYFQAEKPKRLLRSSEISNNVWCSMDGMASGLVFLRVVGIRLQPALRPPGVTIPFTEYMTENVMEYIGPNGDRVQEGVCGAPIVIDDDNQNGGVIGFFQLGARGGQMGYIALFGRSD